MAVPIRNYVSESRRTLAGVVMLIGVLISLEGCGSSTQGPVTPDATVANETNGALFETGDCAPVNLTTRDAGHLNVGYSRAQTPYFVDRTPADPVGFEVAVVNAIARGLGFNSNQVQWKKVAPGQLTTPTRQDLDFSIGQIDSSKVTMGVLQSLPYLKDQQVLIARPDSPLINVTKADELKGAKIGVIKGSVSDRYVTDVLGIDVTAYPSSNALKSAMRDYYINGMVVPLNQVRQVLSTFNGELVIVGQLEPDASATNYVLTMIPGDPLITCVNSVLENMDKTGQLSNLQANWFTSGVNRTISLKE